MERDLQKQLLLTVAGLIFIIVGSAIIITIDCFPLKTVKEFQVDEKSTDWYNTDYFFAQSGDKIVINVDVTGGSAKLRVDKQNGEVIFKEVSGVILKYTVQVPSDDAYIVYIWTRAYPFPSTYVNLTGTIALKHVFPNFYALGVSIGMFVLGSSIIVGHYVTNIYKKRKMEEEKKWRTCPYCGQKVNIEKTICPYCGFDVARSVKCKYCDGFYDRSLTRCPHCGAKNV